uniref:CSON007913 protein n=1 Tax=Culicoides sonorensis TaxID=179676 RepID=A0A336LY25_CULSO
MGCKTSKNTKKYNRLSSRLSIQSRTSNYFEDRYIAPPKSIVHIALFDYEAKFENDISFKKGDLMEISSTLHGDWLMAYHLSNKKRGVVPSIYVAELGSLESNDYFFNNVSRAEAEMLVMADKNPPGTFILRHSGTVSNAFSLTVKRMDDNIRPANYRIRTDCHGFYMITQYEKFRTIHELIIACQANRVKQIRLVRPCPKPVPKMYYLLPQLRDNHETNYMRSNLQNQILQFNEMFDEKASNRASYLIM